MKYFENFIKFHWGYLMKLYCVLFFMYSFLMAVISYKNILNTDIGTYIVFTVLHVIINIYIVISLKRKYFLFRQIDPVLIAILLMPFILFISSSVINYTYIFLFYGIPSALLLIVNYLISIKIPKQN